MSKVQKRRSISVSQVTYQRLHAMMVSTKIPMSALTEKALESLFQNPSPVSPLSPEEPTGARFMVNVDLILKALDQSVAERYAADLGNYLQKNKFIDECSILSADPV